MGSFIGSDEWNMPAHNVSQKAKNLMENNFGDRIMIWSEMAKILLEKGVPAEYALDFCHDTFGTLGDCLDLFNIEIKEALTSGFEAIMKPEEFDVYIKEYPSMSMKDHRVLSLDVKQRRKGIHDLLLGAWGS